MFDNLSKQFTEGQQNLLKEVTKAPLPEKKVLTVADFAKLYEKGRDEQRSFRNRPLQDDPLKITTDINSEKNAGVNSKVLYDTVFTQQWFERNFPSQYEKFVKDGRF
ncbi:MAG: hypothetical protein L3J19_07680 [Sulfurimonas sp.]|nr:hypothetical protein [Sulfurimonas sp.]